MTSLLLGLAVILGAEGAEALSTPWKVRCQKLTGEGPDGSAEVSAWHSLAFYEHHRPLLDWGPTLDWEAIPEDTVVESQPIGELGGLTIHTIRHRIDSQQPWDQDERLLLLAGPGADRLRPVHVLHIGGGIVEWIEPVATVAVGEHTGVRLRYRYSGTGGHDSTFVYVVTDGRPRDIGLRTAWRLPLPDALAAEWERPGPPQRFDQGTWLDLRFLHSAEVLVSKEDGESRGFDLQFDLVDGRLAIVDGRPSRETVLMPGTVVRAPPPRPLSFAVRHCLDHGRWVEAEGDVNLLEIGELGEFSLLRHRCAYKRSRGSVPVVSVLAARGELVQPLLVGDGRFSGIDGETVEHELVAAGGRVGLSVQATGYLARSLVVIGEDGWPVEAGLHDALEAGLEALKRHEIDYDRREPYTWTSMRWVPEELALHVPWKEWNGTARLAKVLFTWEGDTLRLAGVDRGRVDPEP